MLEFKVRRGIVNSILERTLLRSAMSLLEQGLIKVRHRCHRRTCPLVWSFDFLCRRRRLEHRLLAVLEDLKAGWQIVEYFQLMMQHPP